MYDVVWAHFRGQKAVVDLYTWITYPQSWKEQANLLYDSLMLSPLGELWTLTLGYGTPCLNPKRTPPRPPLYTYLQSGALPFCQPVDAFLPLGLLVLLSSHN